MLYINHYGFKGQILIALIVSLSFHCFSFLSNYKESCLCWYLSVQCLFICALINNAVIYRNAKQFWDQCFCTHLCKNLNIRQALSIKGCLHHYIFEITLSISNFVTMRNTSNTINYLWFLFVTCKLCSPPYAVNKSRNPNETTRTFLLVLLINFFILISCECFKREEFVQWLSC